jgi:lysophospholipase L1-like esterase
MGKGFKRAALLAAGIVIPLALLEAVLQVAAFITIGAADEVRAERADGEGLCTVLCVGDSFTYGVGVSVREKAYPAQLEEILNRSGGSWQVINAGWPGRNSSEMVQRLPAWLEKEEPDHVCILIGRNNRWNRAETELALPSLEGGIDEAHRWQWKFRTFRLLTLLWANLTGGREQEEAPRGEGIFPSEEPASRPDEPFPALAEAKRLLSRLENDKAKRLLDDSASRIVASGNQEAIARLAELYGRLWENEKTIEVCLAGIEACGPSAAFSYMLVRPLASTGREQEALSRADEAIALQDRAKDSAPLYRARAFVHTRMGNALKAFADMLTAFSFHGNEGFLENDLDTIKPDLRQNWKHIQGFVDGLALDEGIRKRALDLTALVVLGESGKVRQEGDSAFANKLKADLVHGVKLVRTAGAVPLLLTYPRTLREVDRCVKEAAAESKAVLVDLIPVFKTLLEQEDPAIYFIPDGHPTDSGYQVIARYLAEVIRSIDEETN